MSTQDIDGIYLQDRDFAILRGLYESRVMTVAHAAKLFFDEKIEATRKRLQKLKQAGLIRDRARAHTEPAVLYLAKKGYECLKRHRRLDGFPIITDGAFESRSRVSALTLRHELAVMDAKAALVAALCRTPDITIKECTTWPLLHQFYVRQPAAGRYGGAAVMVKPDGFVCFRQRTSDGIAEHALFIEVDRGTESQKILADRAACYRAHYRSGGFAVSRGGGKEQFEQFPFRVLAIFKTAERRNNAAERLLALDPPIKTMVWLTTMAEFLADPLAAIWVKPGAYEDVVGDGAFRVTANLRLGAYKRSIERDLMVESEVKKCSLLEG